VGHHVEQVDRPSLQRALGVQPGSTSRSSTRVLIGEIDPDLTAIDDRLTLRSLLDRLPGTGTPDRDPAVLWQPHTQIARRCGLSQVHISRLLSQTLTWLRHAMLADIPPPWGTAVNATLDLTRLAVESTPTGRILTVSTRGEIDRDSADQLRQAILGAIASHPTELCLDLSGVPFIDAAGIAALTAGYQQAARAAVGFRIRGTQPHVGRMLAIAHLPHGTP
jgi:RNA polymerase sigma-B factor